VGPFTGAVLVAEEKRLDAGFDAACSRLANLPRIGVLITSSYLLADRHSAGYDRPSPAGPAGLATPPPDCAGEQVHGASFCIAEAEGLHEVAFERGQHGLTS
jgi:hypothetical protein